MATPVAAYQSTYAQIEQKVRYLTASASPQSLSSAAIQQYVNDVYASDFPYGIKVDQMRSVYTFYTQPYIDRYPLDVNYNQGVRAPFYVDGIQGYFYKDRDEFFKIWPRWPTSFQPIAGNGSTATFTFMIPGPFLRGEVTLGGVAVGGNAISVADDGNGNLQLQVPNPVVSVPLQTTNPAIPGMYNINNGSPGLNNVTNIGTVDYVLGNCSITFPAGYIPASGTLMTMRVSQYQNGRPYSMMFWNNFFLVRPVPKLIHKVEIETYLTPVQFMQSTDNPILRQWWKYIALLAARQILVDRQDMEGVANIQVELQRQEGLVLERQGVEEVGSRNATLFAGAQQNQGWNNGWQSGWY